MFLIKNRALRLSVRSTRNLFKNDNKKTEVQPQSPKPSTQTQKIMENTGFVMATQDHSKPFPYKFGGLNYSKKNEPRIQSFMPNKIPNFFQFYLQLLKAVQNKNKKELSKLVEPQLVEPLLSHNVKLINESSTGIFQYNTLAAGFGIYGPRNPKIKINFFSPPNVPKQLDYNIKIYTPQSLMSMFQMTGNASSNFPIMISTQITIKSKACLIHTDSSHHQKEQTHILTFQRQAQIDVSSVMSMMSGMKLAMGASMSSVKSFYYGVDHPWKVANIDNFLKERWQS